MYILYIYIFIFEINTYCNCARLAQLAARRSHNPKVASSILAPSINNFLFFIFYFFKYNIIYCVLVLHIKKYIFVKYNIVLAPLAQLVAHRSYVPRVQGSSP